MGQEFLLRYHPNSPVCRRSSCTVRSFAVCTVRCNGRLPSFLLTIIGVRIALPGPFSMHPAAVFHHPRLSVHVITCLLFPIIGFFFINIALSFDFVKKIFFASLAAKKA